MGKSDLLKIGGSVAVGLGTTIAIIWAKKKKIRVKGEKSQDSNSVSCSKCGRPLKVFSRKYKCSRCGRIYCKDCIQALDVSDEIMKKMRLVDGFVEPENSWLKGYVLCPSCAVGFNQEVRRMNLAQSASCDVELVSINYKGRKRYEGTPLFIETNWYKEKAVAQQELKTLARYHNCNMVVEVEIHRNEEDEETDSGGTYTYSVWKYSGRAVKKV